MLKEKYFNLCRKIWMKFHISLPLRRLLYKKYAEEIQKDLNTQHSIRDTVNAMYGTDYTTLQAYLILNAHAKGLSEEFPLITSENRSYIKK